MECKDQIRLQARIFDSLLKFFILIVCSSSSSIARFHVLSIKRRWTISMYATSNSADQDARVHVHRCPKEVSMYIHSTTYIQSYIHT